MKLSMFLLPVVLILSTFSLDKLTNTGTHHSSVTISERRFLIRIADNRIMNLHESEMALQRGTTYAIKKFSKGIIEDQYRLIREIERLAAQKNIVLPELSPEKLESLKELKTETGKEFDDQFIKLMVIEHHRDVKYFKMAMNFQDPDMRAFAFQYLPLVEFHLESAKALKQ